MNSPNILESYAAFSSVASSASYGMTSNIVVNHNIAYTNVAILTTPLPVAKYIFVPPSSVINPIDFVGMMVYYLCGVSP